MLSAHAPRAWSKRVLSWQIFLGELGLFFTAGKIVEQRSASLLAFEATGYAESAKLEDLVEQYGHEFGHKIYRQLPHGMVDLRIDEWEHEARLFPVELLTLADELDWEEGMLSIFLYGEIAKKFDEPYDSLFIEDEKADLQVDLRDMCFSLESIEMLAPNGQIPGRDELPHVVSRAKVQGSRKGGPGRRREYDWEGALFYLIGEAEKNAIAPDPDAHGAQADIKRKLADWFASNGGKVPADSQLQSYAARALSSIRRATP